MTMHTLSDCAARRVVTAGCRCGFCRGAGALRDGERFRVPALFRDHAATAASMENEIMTNSPPLPREQLRGVYINGQPAAEVFMLDGPSPAFLDGLATGARVSGGPADLEGVNAHRQAAYDHYALRDGHGGGGDGYAGYCQRLADAWQGG